MMQMRAFFIRLCLAAKTTYQEKLALALWLIEHQKLPDEAKLAALWRKPKSYATVVLTQTNSDNAFELYDENEANGGIMTILDEDYPHLLAHSHKPPLILYYRGNKALLNDLNLAVVGSRNHSIYAEHTVDYIVKPLIKRNFCIVSGLALGVDSLAHRAALTHGGKTIAVLGCGLNINYPKQHTELQQLLEQTNLVISEYPKDTPALRHHFPMRNRIIANLAAATLIVEAKQRSGSLITAHIALDNNRTVMAVPGQITHPFAAGTNRLIQAGAILVGNYQDVLVEYIDGQLCSQ